MARRDEGPNGLTQRERVKSDAFATTAGGIVDGSGNVLALTAAQVAATQALVAKDWNTVEPTRGGVLATTIQFRGAADTASSLGALGLIVNASSDSAAGGRLALNDADWISEINGASSSGRTRMIGPYGSAITKVHIGQLGLTAPYTDNASGPVLAASNQMTEINWDSTLGVTALLIVEGGPTNFAGASGTGSARYVIVYGLVERVL